MFIFQFNFAMFRNGSNIAIAFLNHQILTINCDTFATTLSNNFKYVATSAGIWARLALNHLSFFVEDRALPIYEELYNRSAAIYTRNETFITLDHITGTIQVIRPMQKTTIVRRFSNHSMTSYWYTDGAIVQVYPGSNRFNYYSVDDDVFHTDHPFENICYDCFHRAAVLSVRRADGVFLFDLACNYCHVTSFCLGTIFVQDHIGTYTMLTENIAAHFKRHEVVFRNIRTYSTISFPWISRSTVLCSHELQKNVLALVLRREVQMSRIKLVGYNIEKIYRYDGVCVYILKEVPISI